MDECVVEALREWVGLRNLNHYYPSGYRHSAFYITNKRRFAHVKVCFLDGYECEVVGFCHQVICRLCFSSPLFFDDLERCLVLCGCL